MRKKIIFLILLIINIILIKNEVINYDGHPIISTNNNTNTTVRENNSDNNTQNHQNEFHKELNQTSNSNKTENIYINLNTDNNINIETNIKNNSLSLEENDKIISHENSLKNSSFSFVQLNQTDSENIRINNNKDEINQKNNNFEEKIISQEKKNEDLFSQTKDEIKIKHFNLTEEIEKLYYNRQNETKDHLDDTYEDDHNSQFYENIEEVKMKQEEEENFKKQKEEAEKLRKEWEEKVSDFTAQDLLTIKLKKYSTYNFYENIEKTPSIIKIAFIVNDELKKINFEIQGPNGKSIFVEKNKSQSYYEFDANLKGVYNFMLTNHESLSSIKVTFALHTGENFDSHLKNSHLDEFSQHLKHVEKKFKELKFSLNILNKKYDGHHASNKLIF